MAATETTPVSEIETAGPAQAASDGSSGPLLEPDFLHKLEQLELVSKRIFVGRMKGERKSKRRGSSVEFAEHRNYTVGDDMRHIDWNVYGRLDKLFLKLFLEEEDLHVYACSIPACRWTSAPRPSFATASRSPRHWLSSGSAITTVSWSTPSAHGSSGGLPASAAVRRCGE